MSRLLGLAVLIGALTTVACGATARDTSAPVYTPPSTSAPAPENAPAATAQTSPTEVTGSQRGVIPAGQELDVRLETTLSSATAAPEQRFQATTVADLTQDGRALVPAGSVVRGVVASVDKADRIHRAGSLTLSFDRLTVNGRAHTIRGMATQVFQSGGITEEGGKAGVGAGVGGVIGGVLGGVKGAILGAVIGAGGAIAATEGKDIELPAGSIIRIRIDSPVRVQ
jgi:hypothetical protein